MIIFNNHTNSFTYNILFIKANINCLEFFILLVGRVAKLTKKIQYFGTYTKTLFVTIHI